MHTDKEAPFRQTESNSHVSVPWCSSSELRAGRNLRGDVEWRESPCKRKPGYKNRVANCRGSLR